MAPRMPVYLALASLLLGCTDDPQNPDPTDTGAATQPTTTEVNTNAPTASPGNSTEPMVTTSSPSPSEIGGSPSPTRSPEQPSSTATPDGETETSPQTGTSTMPEVPSPSEVNPTPSPTGMESSQTPSLSPQPTGSTESTLGEITPSSSPWISPSPSNPPDLSPSPQPSEQPSPTASTAVTPPSGTVEPTEITPPDPSETSSPTPIVNPTEPPERDDTYYYHPERLLEVSIEMDPNDFYELSHQERSFFDLVKGEDCRDTPTYSPYTWFEANVFVDGTYVEKVGVRKKAFYGSASTSKPGLKLKFDKFVDDQELDGLERLTLNNSASDPSFMHQCLTYQTFRDAGMPSSRCSFAKVTVNGEYLGVYVNVEPVKKDMLRDHFPDEDGDLYEGALSDFRDEWDGSFEAKTSSTDEEFGPILALTEAVKVEDDELISTLSQLMDIDNFMTYWVLEVLVAQSDSYSSFSNNYYAYREPSTDLIYFIPWGADASMTSQVGLYASSILNYRLYKLPEYRQIYLDRMGQMLDLVWNEDELLMQVDRYEELLLPHALDPEEAALGIAGLRDFISGRRAFLEPILEAGGEELEGEPRQPLCMPYRGQVEMSFTTTWGSLQSEANPEDVGTLQYTWNDPGTVWLEEDSGTMEGSASSGFEGEGSDTVRIDVQTLINRNDLYLGSLYMPEANFVEGTQSYDGRKVYGYLEYEDTRYDSTRPVGIFADGEITFEQVSTEDGGQVIGTCYGDLYGFF